MFDNDCQSTTLHNKKFKTADEVSCTAKTASGVWTACVTVSADILVLSRSHGSTGNLATRIADTTDKKEMAKENAAAFQAQFQQTGPPSPRSESMPAQCWKAFNDMAAKLAIHLIGCHVIEALHHCVGILPDLSTGGHEALLASCA